MQQIVNFKQLQIDMRACMEDSWMRELKQEFSKDYFLKLVDFVKTEYQAETVFPPRNLIFNAFDSCPFDKVKVVILGQDPYHGSGQAHGLCFSVPKGIPSPPSLINIYKELDSNNSVVSNRSGSLQHWAEQGVLLLNATLTVRAQQARSHQNKGWEDFTDATIQTLAYKKQNVVFILWGSYAQKKGSFIDTKQHLVLKAPHPSPLSAYRGFFGCNHFKKTNKYLQVTGQETIKW